MKPATAEPVALPRAALDPVVLRLFNHHLYEFGRGVRALFLMTMRADEAVPVCTRLRTEGIEHFMQVVNPGKVNLFFGKAAYVETARCIVTRPLNRLTPQEDFMLGTLLGYDGEQQCRRFIDRNARALAAQMPLLAAE